MMLSAPEIRAGGSAEECSRRAAGSGLHGHMLAQRVRDSRSRVEPPTSLAPDQAARLADGSERTIAALMNRPASATKPGTPPARERSSEAEPSHRKLPKNRRAAQSLTGPLLGLVAVSCPHRRQWMPSRRSLISVSPRTAARSLQWRH